MRLLASSNVVLGTLSSSKASSSRSGVLHCSRSRRRWSASAASAASDVSANGCEAWAIGGGVKRHVSAAWSQSSFELDGALSARSRIIFAFAARGGHLEVMRVLLDAGIATDERPKEDARARVFRLRPESMQAVNDWLDQLQKEWDAQLRSFKRHVERRNKR